LDHAPPLLVIISTNVFRTKPNPDYRAAPLVTSRIRNLTGGGSRAAPASACKRRMKR
jgi:hypothetical protein